MSLYEPGPTPEPPWSTPEPPPAPPAPVGPQRLDPRQIQVWRLQRGIGALVLGAQLGAVELVLRLRDVAVPGPPGAIVLTAVLVSIGFALWWPRLQYERWTYEIAGIALELYHGVITRSHSAIPYFRVQHVDITRGPLERLLGLSTLVVHTASAATDAQIPGISAHAAESLRDVILARTGRGDAV